MDGTELPPDIAAETYAPTQVERAPFRGNKPQEREDDTLRRSEPPAIDAVLNGHGPQALNLDIGSSADGSTVATAAAREAGADRTSYWESASWEVRGIAPGATVHPTASIADDVQIDNGAYIGESVRLESRVHVAQGATIEAGTVVRSATRIGERSHIQANCTIDGHVGDGVRIEAGARVGRKREAEHEGRRSGTPITVCGGAVIGKGVTIDKPGTVVPPGWTVNGHNIESLPARETETSVQGILEGTSPATWGNREPGSRPPGVSPEAEIAPSALLLPGAQIGPGAKIRENCEIGRRARIEAGASIGRGTRIGPGATVGADSVVEDEVHVRAGATIEPECLVRRRTTIAAEAVVRKGTDFGRGEPSRLEGGAIASPGDPAVEEAPRPWVAPARIHPSAQVHPTASVAPGATVGEGACIDANTQIGGGVQIEHHARVEAGVVMEAGSRAGAGAVIRENAYVAAGADVGAWSVTEEGARVGIRASIGENGRVRAGTEVPAHQTVYPNETFDGTARRAAATAPVRPATAGADRTEQARTRSGALTRS